MVLMLERRVPETGYWFLPSRRDWRIGVLHYLYYLPIGFGLALGRQRSGSPALGYCGNELRGSR